MTDVPSYLRDDQHLYESDPRAAEAEMKYVNITTKHHDADWDAATLREIGRRIRQSGWPGKDAAE